jgi:exopolysaccharide biosynthesis polyprenyl glycosylphosphotransferase
MWNIRRLNKPSRSGKKDFFVGGSGLALIAEAAFVKMLHVEQKRTERSSRRFGLMLLECRSLLPTGNSAQSFDNLLLALLNATRETDIKGWYKDGSVIGVIFTEFATADHKLIAKVLLQKVNKALSAALNSEQVNRIEISFHVFPEDWHQKGNDPSDSVKLHPDLVRYGRNTPSVVVKRVIDIVGSVFALVLLSPVLLAIAVAIKLTSKGPVFFRQHRVGHRGRQFKFLKFRSMYTANNSAIHQQYMKGLISGGTGSEQAANQQQKVYKLTHDPRITQFGRILRRTSLDEFPQFLNVLKGDMSLVGPRPPIPYEVDCYDIWHKQRLLAVKPGITGLWQVKGRSRVRFDDMVRLDLEYARSWSLWLDIKILLQTPRAILTGDGAY